MNHIDHVENKLSRSPSTNANEKIEYHEIVYITSISSLPRAMHIWLCYPGVKLLRGAINNLTGVVHEHSMDLANLYDKEASLHASLGIYLPVNKNA